MLFGKKEKIELLISGMKCEKCSANVKKALEAIKGVKAEVDHVTGKAAVTVPAGLDKTLLIKAIEAIGFKAE